MGGLPYDFYADQVRNKLYHALMDIDKETGARKPLEPAFFYGIEQWRSIDTLDNAAMLTSQKISSSSVTINRNSDPVDALPLYENSVVAIFDFINDQSFEEEDHPLNSVIIWRSGWEKSYSVDQGAKRYVAHRKECIAINGKLYRNKRQVSELSDTQKKQWEKSRKQKRYVYRMTK